MSSYIHSILERETFSSETAASFIHGIGEKTISEAEIAAVITGIQLRGASIDELKGFQKALLERALIPDINTENAIDLCGTGGDGKDTFNISTTSALVLAAMGYKVIKHGNYGVSSSCGSSNVLEALGFQFTNKSSELQHHLDTQNICFLHATLFHPTLKEVASIRKDLGIRTLFNSLGPLVNPVQPPFQLTGTYSLELARIYQHVLRPVRERYAVVYGMDGFDEVSLTNATRKLSGMDDRILVPKDFGATPIELKEIHSGATIASAARILKEVASGQGTEAQTEVIAANVALALQIFHENMALKDAFREAKQFIRSGQTAKHFKL